MQIHRPAGVAIDRPWCCVVVTRVGPCNRLVSIEIKLRGKVEHPRRSGGQELYQLLSYKGDVDFEAKLDEWERFNNFHRPYGAHNGKTPYETLREKL